MLPCTPFSAALSSDALRAKGSMSKPTCRQDTLWQYWLHTKHD